MEENMASIGRHLKRLRGERGWSLDRTAKATGVSKAMLGQIERGESMPTVATLWRIASGIQAPLSHFLSPIVGETRSAPAAWHRDVSGMVIQPLFAFDPALGFEMYLIELAAAGASESTPHAAGVIEHVVVIAGELELTVDDRRYCLGAGEAMRFPADQPHGYRNLTSHPVRFHDLIHYPLHTHPAAPAS
ncbi:helix-turn-helix domain-containing protein [Salinicola rhizosphaerae]|uniref:HTH-type transcriptional regulator SutR n=1 Tax=Salinicola rhizosphaerae TaxID=1443141 RepID=A0ABQ3DQC7_9GAMM|nr:XRE family transcriptional regulator [Salinicola rhizosphaerae]GHB08462.1 HTH-type transcriptional regulator SutR [Salinicola rhizosphaerae]